MATLLAGRPAVPGVRRAGTDGGCGGGQFGGTRGPPGSIQVYFELQECRESVGQRRDVGLTHCPLKTLRRTVISLYKSLI